MSATEYNLSAYIQTTSAFNLDSNLALRCVGYLRKTRERSLESIAVQPRALSEVALLFQDHRHHHHHYTIKRNRRFGDMKQNFAGKGSRLEASHEHVRLLGFLINFNVVNIFTFVVYLL